MPLAVPGGGVVPLLGRAKLLFDTLGAVRGHQVETKRHLLTAKGAVHKS